MFINRIRLSSNGKRPDHPNNSHKDWSKKGYRHLDVLSQQAGQRKGDQRPLRVEGRPTNPGLRPHA